MGGSFCFVETPSEKFWSFFLSYAISGSAAPYYKQKPPNRGTLMRPERGPAPTSPLSPAAPQRRIPMNTKNFPLEAHGAAVSREELVQAALDEITQNYREASLSNVARSYGVSLAYVSECVRAQTGRTYKELLQKHRMETAARLLRRSDWNIQQIITYVGYENTSYFYRLFHERYGQSPREYRQSRAARTRTPA